MEYVVTLERDTNSSYWVRCPDIPEMNSVGDTVEDALKYTGPMPVTKKLK